MPSLVQKLSIDCQYGVGGLTSGLVAYWNLNETSGNRADALGLFPLTNNGSVGYTTGLIGNAANFTGSQNLTNSSIAFGSTYTISCWVYVPAGGGPFGNTCAWGIGGTSTPQIALTMYNTAVFAFKMYVNGTNGAIAGVSYNTWHHCVFTYSDPYGILYVDNSKIDVTPINNAGAETTAISVGSFVGNTQYITSGRIDEFGVWNRVLSSAEISSLYNSGVGKTYPFS